MAAQQAGDVPLHRLGRQRVAGAVADGEDVAALGVHQALVDVHAGPGAAVDGLDHERRVVPVPAGDGAREQPEQDRLVDRGHPRRVAEVDLDLGRAVLHIARLAVDAGPQQRFADGAEHRVEFVGPVDRVAERLGGGLPPVGVEEVELQLRRLVDGQTEVGVLAQGPLEHRPRVHRGRLAGVDVDGVADDHRRALGPSGYAERVEVGDDRHVLELAVHLRPRGGLDVGPRVPGQRDGGGGEASAA